MTSTNIAAVPASSDAPLSPLFVKSANMLANLSLVSLFLSVVLVVAIGAGFSSLPYSQALLPFWIGIVSFSIFSLMGVSLFIKTALSSNS